MAASSEILQSYLIGAFKAESKLDFEELLQYNSQMKGGDFLTPLSFYLDILDNTDKVIVPYLSPKRKAQLAHDLQIAYLLLLAQQRYELDRQKTENRKDYDDEIQKCQELLDDLNPEWQAIIKQAPEQECFSDGKPVKYCGIALAHVFADTLVACTDGTTRTIKGALGAVNEKRLSWVWDSLLLKTILALLPEDFFNTSQATDAVKAPDPYTGCLSWGLYYFRFSLNLFLLLKHTIKGPWMSAEEAKTPWYERFQTQWAQRKFNLLNDLLWGTSNLLGYFWLNGKGTLGALGDALTIVLLVFDISVALWDFAEQETAYNARMLQFAKDIENIEKLMKQEKQLLHLIENLNDDNKNKTLKSYQMQLNALKREEAQCRKAWTLQKLGLYTTIGYAVGLMMAFTLLTSSITAISVAGAVLCFAFTVIANAIKGGIEIYKTRQSIKDLNSEYQEHVGLLKNMLKTNPDLNDNEKKFLYLEIKQLLAKTEYQKQMVKMQSMQLFRSIIIESLVPAIIFTSLVFFPLSIGLAAIGAALGLAIASNVLINALFKPDEKMKELPPFDEQEYQSFCGLVAKESKSNLTAPQTFFKQKNATSKVIDASFKEEPESCWKPSSSQ